MHGYSSNEEDMRAIFIAQGPAFKPIRECIPAFLNVEIYQLICKILGIPPAPNNGTLGFLDAPWLVQD